ncbi:hypothetical protein Q8A67_014841 [Cirrhinus molitorella]|uniref:RanBP2-type domain-containing protein n=1 Tax=Cirrhinus molitorella TaxID=172907 RepID=A0AA88TLC5_9TELE|nr:hypothetical protein Q8A67_014841 [Cirrhinus molitorella]
MGDKKSPTRPKRQAKPTADDGFWDCSVCTFRNSAEAFKCSICDVRKGTSTRKPRINSQLVAQQVAQQYAIPPPPKKEKKEKPERPEKERAEGERPDRNPQDGENTDKDKSEKEQPDKEKKDREKEITPAITKKPNSKKNKPKSDSHQSPPSERNSIQSGKSTTKTNNSHISRPKLKNIDRSTAQQLAITVGNVTVIITDFKEKTRTSSTSSSTVTSSAGSEQQHQSSGSESMDKGSSRASTPKGDLSVGHDETNYIQLSGDRLWIGLLCLSRLMRFQTSPRLLQRARQRGGPRLYHYPPCSHSRWVSSAAFPPSRPQVPSNFFSLTISASPPEYANKECDAIWPYADHIIPRPALTFDGNGSYHLQAPPPLGAFRISQAYQSSPVQGREALGDSYAYNIGGEL